MMNFKEMSIGKKTALAFSFILMLLAVIILLNLGGVRGIVGNAEKVIKGNQLDGLLAQKEVDHLNWTKKLTALLTDDTVTTLAIETDDHKCGFGRWLYGQGRKDAEALVPSLAPQLKEIEKYHLALHESAIEIGNVFKPGDVGLPVTIQEVEIKHLQWGIKIRDALLNRSKTLNVKIDPTQCAMGKWLLTGQSQKAYERGSAEYRRLFEHIKPIHSKMHESAGEIKNLLAAGNFAGAQQVFQNKTSPLINETINSLYLLKTEAERDLEGMKKANAIYAEKTAPALHSVQKTLRAIRKEAKNNVMTDEILISSANKTKLYVTVIGLIAFAAGVVLAFLAARGTTSILKRISEQMETGANQVASAAGEISSASQALADGASEQASTLEETSASLEEITSMTSQNAANAARADNLMQEARSVIGDADDSMKKLTTSMEEISKASEDTSKIVKTIDEVAFQTNLLALNAAVEAARAGEAGAGFAVVADEVRNLAMRAAQAAKNTSDLIEGTVIKIQKGSDLVSETDRSFSMVTQSAETVTNLVSEIAAASREQAQGLEQLNRAVTEIDRVTQQNAASSEESASASEELNSQAEAMQETVNELLALVGSGRKNLQAKSMAQLSDTGISRKAVPAVSCWKIKNCPPERRDGCPAFPSSGDKCWLVTGTFCGGKQQGSYHEKMANCKQCDVYQIVNNNSAYAAPPQLAHQ